MDPFLANFISVAKVLIVELYIFWDALRTDRIRHSNGRVRLPCKLLRKQISINPREGLVSDYLGPQLRFSLISAWRCVSNFERTTGWENKFAIRTAVFVAVLVGIFADLDHYSCSSGVVRCRWPLELGQNEEKFKDKWYFLSSADSRRYSCTHHIDIFGCWWWYGFNRLFKMLGNDVGNAIANGASRVCIGWNS